MPTHLRFLFVCDRQFDELPGEDPQQRRCDACATTVHNLDALPERRRLELLERAGDERTTVCVSVSVPQGAAQACRGGEPVPADAAATAGPVVALAGRVAPRPPLTSPPRRDEPGTTARSFAADLPAVEAGLEATGPAFGLRRDPRGVWLGHEPAHALTLAVAAEPDGAQAAVLVRIDPPPASPPVVASPRVFGGLAVVVLAPLWLFLAFVLWLAAAPLRWLLLGPTAIVGLLATIIGGFLAVSAFGERARRRARDRWIAAWYQRFWPALTARLAEGPPYR